MRNSPASSTFRTRFLLHVLIWFLSPPTFVNWLLQIGHLVWSRRLCKSSSSLLGNACWQPFTRHMNGCTSRCLLILCLYRLLTSFQILGFVQILQENDVGMLTVGRSAMFSGVFVDVLDQLVGIWMSRNRATSRRSGLWAWENSSLLEDCFLKNRTGRVEHKNAFLGARPSSFLDKLLHFRCNEVNWVNVHCKLRVSSQWAAPP